MKNYRFGLFEKNGNLIDEKNIDGNLIDETNIDENNSDFAMELFKEFSAVEGYNIYDGSGHYVKLLDETDETDETDEK